ncbi:TolC family protein [Thermomonas sp.]|uniref:TolC family protein n=1 Tax=Thermomonas sp. TaxID=1971895 RepID=UPI0024877B1D|nr:TolC family protein [Thermomonas sp.]MDI1252115.1 TolC family protein [Thermomonas sp.]
MHPAPSIISLRKSATLLLTLGLAACAAYVPHPLDTHSHRIGVDAIQVSPEAMPLPALRTHRFDPGDGLDMTETAMLAVANNPDLRVARDAVGIARAQAFAAGLLPDPQLSLSADHPSGNIAGSNTNAFGLGLSYDINALLRRSAEHASARAAQTRGEQELLWQEWQVVAQARLLFVRSVEGERLLALLEHQRALFVDRQARLRRAFDDGNVTVDAVATDYAALQGVEQKKRDTQRTLAKNRHDLNNLLGLDPGIQLRLVGDDAPLHVDATRVRALLQQLPEIRPDLRALAAGYSSQDEKYRAAVVAQFPMMSIGFNHARDTSGIYTTGFGLSLSLPIFNGNRGNIAIEKVTRQRLYDDYQARLAAATAEIEVILDDRALAREQLAAAQASVAGLHDLSAHSQAAYSAGGIDVLTYANQRDALLSAQMEVLKLEQALREQEIGLQGLLGSALPADATDTPAAGDPEPGTAAPMTTTPTKVEQAR